MLAWAWRDEGWALAQTWGGKGLALSGSRFHRMHSSGRGAASGLQGGLGLVGNKGPDALPNALSEGGQRQPMNRRETYKLFPEVICCNKT